VSVSVNDILHRIYSGVRRYMQGVVELKE
jgi:hypothetical protein